MVSAILFDIDDTLIDFSRASRRGLRAYLAEIAGPIGPENADRAVAEWSRLEALHYGEFLSGARTFQDQRRARVRAFREHVGAIGDPDPDVWMAGFLGHCEAAFALFPDVEPVVDGLCAAGTPVGAMSNSTHAYQEHKLTLVGLRSRLRTLTCCDDAGGAAKPNPEIFHVACRALGLPPAEVAYVGDRIDHDARAATAAGLHGVWLDRDGSHAPPDVSRVRSLLDLPAVLPIHTPTTPKPTRTARPDRPDPPGRTAATTAAMGMA